MALQGKDLHGSILQRREFLKQCGVGSLLAFSPLFAAGCEKASRPNIVLVVVDDLGWADLGSYGSAYYETPALDHFAQSAVRFTHAYAASPVCSPTRAAIMTGQHPARLHITDWIPGQDPQDRKLVGPQDRDALPLASVTLAEALKEKGYTTFFAGKWHLGSEGAYPEEQGFDFNIGGHERGSPPGGYYSPYKNPRLSDGPEGEYLPDRLTDEAIAFIEHEHTQPFLLTLCYYTVHTPIQASVRHMEAMEAKAAAMELAGPAMIEERLGHTKMHQDNAAYASMVAAMDENFGRLLRALEQQGITQETVVVFTSDNGGLSTLEGNREAPTSNSPLRAGKGWCYEGGIRVPLLIGAPGLATPGHVVELPVISTDLYPTLLDLADVDPSSDIPVDGKSLVPLLEGGKALHRDALYWHFPHYHGSAWTPGAAIREGNWKLIEFYEEDRAELYHLGNDPGEREDLSGQHPDIKDALRRKLRAWQQTVDAQMPTPNHPQ